MRRPDRHGGQALERLRDWRTADRFLLPVPQSNSSAPRPPKKERHVASLRCGKPMLDGADAWKGKNMTSESSKPLQGRVAIVTGASSGIGEATAVALSAAGAKVAIVARRADRLEALAKRILDAEGEALPIPADASLESEAKRMLGAVEDRYGRLDILVNNAGVMLLSPIAEAEIADFRRMIEINLFGLMTLSRLALPIM